MLLRIISSAKSRRHKRRVLLTRKWLKTLRSKKHNGIRNGSSYRSKLILCRSKFKKIRACTRPY